MPGMNLAEMFAQNQGNGFSGNYNYQPSLRPMQANPLAQGVQAGNPKGTATLGGIDAAMAKRGSQDNNAQRLSSAGESSGVAFKHDNDGHATGSSAFDTLDGYMKKAGLNSFQTQFFSRMVESGMPEVMIEASIKTAGDRFGAEVHAELQDGYEKLAIAAIAKPVLGWLGRTGSKALGNYAREGVKATGKGAFGQAGSVAPVAASGLRGAAQGTANAARSAAKRVVGNTAQTGVKGTGRGAFGQAGSVPARSATGLTRAAQGLGNYIGAPSLQAVGRKGFGEGAKQYAKGLAKNMSGRATTGGVFGAIDPNNEYMGGDESTLANIAGGMGMGIFGGKGGQRIMRRGAAGQALGGISDLAGLTDNAATVGRYGGMLSPNRISSIPGLSGMASRVGTGEAKMLPAIARKLGLQGMGKATTNREFAQQLVKTPLSSGYTQTGKGNLGLLDSADPFNQIFRGAGAAMRGGKNMLANTNPALAAAGTTAAIGVPTAMYGVNKMNEMGNLGQQTADNANQVLLNANNQINDLIQSTDQQVREATKPENLAIVGKHMMQDPEVQSQVNDLASGAFGNFMQNAGTGVLGAVENFLGEDAASFLQKHWPLLLAGAAGIGGGALMGGGTGALLGGVAMPLAMMMAQESGMFGGGEDQQQQEGSQYQSPVAVPGSVSVEGPEGMRSELEANSGQYPSGQYPDEGLLTGNAPVAPRNPTFAGVPPSGS